MFQTFPHNHMLGKGTRPSHDDLKVIKWHYVSLCIILWNVLSARTLHSPSRIHTKLNICTSS